MPKKISTRRAARPATREVAIQSHRQFGLAEIVKASELIYARPARGKGLSLFAAKSLNLMLGVAGGAGFEDRVYEIPKKELRRGHKGNERIPDMLDELMTTQFKLDTVSPRGRPAILTAGLLSSNIEELDDAADDSLVYFRFTREFIEIHRRSDLWAKLSGQTMLAFDSAYSLKLYEIGCQMAGRRDPSMILSVSELRAVLGVPEGAYRDWTDLRRFTLDKAKTEIDQLAHFALLWREKRQGRKVVSVELSFWPKPGKDAIAAYEERERHRAGRRARREGTVERILDDDEASRISR